MFFSTFTQIIQDNGIDTKLIYITQDSPEIIKDVTANNKYFDVLRAVELFNKTGNPKGLKKYYEDDSDLKVLLDLMESFYKNIQICKPVNNETGIEKIYKGMLDQIDELMNKDIDIIIKLLLPTIKSKFMPVEGCNEPFIQILKWCCNNDMILTGFFILDSEYKLYLYNKKVIQFKGFDKNGTNINLTNPGSNAIKNLGYCDGEKNKKTKNKDKYKYYEEKDKNKYSVCINGDTIRYNDCLSIIFRYIVEQTRCVDCSKLNPDCPNDYFKKMKECLENWEVCLDTDDRKNLKLYELILLQDFIRNLRNSMAHSDIKYIIKGKQNVRNFVKKRFNKNILSPQEYNGKVYDDITFDDKEIYGKLTIILKQSIDIIKENVKYISVEVKENGN